MIVTSMRCYLNILTQLMSKDELLNAQYFIADRQSTSLSGMRGFSSDMNIEWDMELGQFVEKLDSIIQTSRYCIEYATDSCSLSISQFLTKQAIQIDDFSCSRKAHDRYRTWLYQPVTMMSVYSHMISKIRADKLFIMIFTDEPTVRYAGDIACKYLSEEFGQDILFIDPQYRPHVKGRPSYIGNKARAENNIMNIRQQSLISGFMSALSNSNFESSTSNLETFLTVSMTDISDLIWFHNILWPDDKLPPGNYTKADLVEIILGKALNESSMRNQRLNNMRIIDELMYDR